ncbi:MAG: T9SS type A sorting domain-containing protein [Bacteroidota bacterium]|nr:T9SS type A sorting domain-containing protein [Bacteroidota bacterium]
MKSLAAVFLVLVLSAPLLSAQGWEWQNPLPHGQGINDITMVDAQTGVAACDNGYYLFTANAGITWSTRRIARASIARMLGATDGGILAVCDKRRIYRSADRAYSWDLVYEGFDNGQGQPSDMTAVDANTFVGFLNGAHLVISEDGGRNWRQITSVNFLGETLYSISAQSPTTWFIVTSRNVLKTSDRGKTWQYVNEEYQARGLQRFVYVDSLYGYQLREGQLLRTHDGGASWTEMDIFGFDTVTDLVAGAALGENVFCMSRGRYLINKSDDAGASWNISLTESAFDNANPRAIAFIDDRTGFIAGDGGRILRTVDGGLSWSIVHGIGYIGTVADLLFWDRDHGVATTFSSTLLVTSDGGNRWDEVLPSAAHSLRHVSRAPEGTLYVVGVTSGNEYELLRSDDEGLSWTLVSRLPLDYQSNRPEITQSLYARAGGEIWIGATYSILLHSTDGGMTWERSVVGTSIQNPYSTGTDMFFFDPSTVIYIRSNSVEISTDGGETWESRFTSAGRSLREVQFVSPDVGFALIPMEFARTTDGGATWDISWNFSPTLLHYFDENNGVMLWSNGDEDDLAYLLRSSDGGRSWERFSMNERVSFGSWFWLNTETAWAYGYSGMIRRTDNGGIASAPALAAMPAGLQLQPGYPNPYTRARHDAVTVPFTLARPARVTLTLYDMLGRPAATLERGGLEAGTHNIVIDRSTLVTLAPGMYLYRIRAGAELQTGRILLR